MKPHIRFVYSIWAPIYDRWIDRLFPFFRERVIKELCLKQGEHVLEIGVGTGLNLPHYPAGVSVTGIDISSAMLARAGQKKARARITLLCRDASRTGFRRSVFDKALATYVLRVSPAPRKVLTEVARVTKPGARLVILDQFRDGKSVLSRFLEPFTLLLGWGRNHCLSLLIRGTTWKTLSRKRFGKMRGTQLVVLKNTKRG